MADPPTVKGLEEFSGLLQITYSNRKEDNNIRRYFVIKFQHQLISNHRSNSEEEEGEEGKGVHTNLGCEGEDTTLPLNCVSTWLSSICTVG